MNVQEGLGTTIAPTNTSAQSSNSMSALTGDDFFRLLIAQLSTQDPMEPMSNEDIMRQMSSIRDIEANTTLTETLQSLVGQQHFAGASALIGKYVTGTDGEDGADVSGVVVGARFAPGGQAVLILESGDELPMSQVGTIEAADHLGEALVGKYVTGVDRRDPANPLEVAGIITSVNTGEKGALVLELDNGASLKLAEVSSIGSPPEQESVVEKVLGAPAKIIQTVLGL